MASNSREKDGGYLLIPVNKGREQILYRYRRQQEEVIIEQSVSCRFVPLLGGVATDSNLEPPTEAESTPHIDGEQLA